MVQRCTDVKITMTTNRTRCLVPVLCAVFASVRGIHIHSASASHLGNQIPIQGRDSQRSFSWFSPSGESNVHVRQWQSARQSEASPWGQSWSWSWNTGTGSNPPQNPDPTWPPPSRGATADRNLNTRPRNGATGTQGNSLAMRPNEVLKTVQKVNVPSFSRNHLKATSLSIQRALTDMVTNWFGNGGNIAKKQMQSLMPKSTVTTKQKRVPLVKPARDVPVSNTVTKLTQEPSTSAVHTPVTRQPAPSPGRPTMTEELLPPEPVMVNADNILPAYTNTISKHRTNLIGRRKIVKFVNNVKIPTFRRSHLRGDSQSIQRALVKAVTGWAGYIAPGISGSTRRTANKQKSDRRRVKESRKRNIPTVTNQWDIPPPPIPIPAQERTNMQPIPVSLQEPPKQKQQQQQPPPKPFTDAHPPPIPLPPSNSGPRVRGRLRDDAAGAARPRSEVRDTANTRRAYIIPIAIIRNSPNRAGNTEQQRPRGSDGQSPVAERRRKPRPKPRNPSDSFLTALLFSLPRGSFPRSMRADLSGQMAPRPGDATPRTPHQVYTEEPGEEMEL